MNLTITFYSAVLEYLKAETPDEDKARAIKALAQTTNVSWKPTQKVLKQLYTDCSSDDPVEARAMFMTAAFRDISLEGGGGSSEASNLFEELQKEVFPGMAQTYIWANKTKNAGVGIWGAVMALHVSDYDNLSDMLEKYGKEDNKDDSRYAFFGTLERGLLIGTYL